MRVAVAQGDWSWAINLENLGMHYAFHVLGPPQPARREAKQGGADEGILHFDCERVIAPRNYSPRRNRCSIPQSKALVMSQVAEL